ncbi:dTMP kinase [Natronomonas sp. EA1]|uniref:dTMP kinase n=1 Tax=Natronomonas sp. EA1 TaxID=3421655 RepID=UPI003EBF1755
MLVTLEGIDGSGKTTVWEALHDRFGDATFTREPTESWYGEAVLRSINEDTADPLAELFLFIADHADHLSRVIRPALADDRLVIADRYVDSRIAYQGATLAGEIDRPMEYIKGVHLPFTRMPDATLYFDLDPETGAERAGTTNKLEDAAYLASVQSNYERLMKAEPERFVRIDASRPPEDVIEAAEEAIERLVTDN